MIFPLASPSTSSFNTDSPILPLEEGESPTVSAGCNHGHLDSGREYAPSNAYTFGLSAPAAPDASSAISIPTSFQSAFGSETMSRVESITADWAVQTVHRQSSLASSRSLSSLPVGRDSIRHEDHLSNMREWLRPNPVPSPTFMPLHLSRPAPDPPVLTGALSNSKGGGKSSRFLSLDKLKGFSSRIKALVKGKQGANRIGGTIAVATSISVTAEEYSSVRRLERLDSQAINN
ncbi:hypothetical protein PHLCEN_2v11727 [Hermanssonia centrifuga]|uniref:Uncharacterized protein n=1 Tax=Hermanssonia centrifuga TaxID=98765 RepID=A0A2R6NJ50_9APHY|nr:hypothetical protein PHLCEN_2v11727 [Hermanssonia centrifuga]